jgi:hypothetical protein
LPHATRLHKEQLLSLPLCCSGKWVRVRPIYYVEDRELRACLHRVLADHYFWTPPCDFAELPQLAASLNLIQLDPVLTVRENREEARELGESLKSGFQRSVDQLSNDLAETMSRRGRDWQFHGTNCATFPSLCTKKHFRSKCEKPI